MTQQGLSAAPAEPQAARHLSELRERLDYVARKSSEAANHVLNAVEQAKAEQERIGAALRELRGAAAGSALQTAVDRAAATIESSSSRANDQLTDILLAQGYHDLIGQVLAKAGQLAHQLEAHLVDRSQDTSTEPGAGGRTSADLAGPVMDGGRDDVLTNQAEVDALLAKTGF
jgi:chemotaxis protein CheZ